ncbi:hypothetical protein [Cellulosilyticum sp. WCF-2]|uniref:hypothetical protein n=1 Tax=Cellulosilyticum sp. WCF-2 TaxID=2497860 RepID=UPI000F8E2117|nr:hypothetical protein [Cellulosilyticum sp. WCF-2]QEH67294.1 hypothetical protein EKH84_02115 [Cellulosilyticum sp. WCF-2]
MIKSKEQLRQEAKGKLLQEFGKLEIDINTVAAALKELEHDIKNAETIEVNAREQNILAGMRRDMLMIKDDVHRIRKTLL